MRRPGHADAKTLAPGSGRMQHAACSMQHEGLSAGGAAGINLAAAIRVARNPSPGHVAVTILCDGGSRYQSQLFNPSFLQSKGLPVPSWRGA
jgi:cysteine synthase A